MASRRRCDGGRRCHQQPVPALRLDRLQRASPGAAASGEANDRHFERVTLEWRGRARAAQPGDPAVSVRLRSRGGRRARPEGQGGLAYLTGRMLLRGSAGRTFAEINDITDGLGASIGVGPGRTSTDISIKCLAEDLPQMLDLAAAALRSP